MLIFDFWICNFSSWFFATSSKWTIHEIEIFVKAAHNLVNRLEIVAKVSGKTQIIFCTLDGTFFASGDCFEAFVHVFEIVSFWIRWNNTVGSKCFLNFHLFQQVKCSLEVIQLIRCFWNNFYGWWKWAILLKIRLNVHCLTFISNWTSSMFFPFMAPEARSTWVKVWPILFQIILDGSDFSLVESRSQTAWFRIMPFSKLPKASYSRR